jgi:uroporphyrinogen decarboxylase
MNHRERLETVLAGQNPDRVPVALWRHFPVDDQEPESLADATIDYQRTFDFDLVKVTPASSFCIKDWGVDDEWRGASEGTRDYTVHRIHAPEDWRRLAVLDPQKGHLGQQLECLRRITRALGSNAPVIQTIFNPLAQAKNLVGGADLLVHLRQYPDALHTGLKVIAESTRQFIEAAKSTGIAGVFYAVQHAQYQLLSEAEYTEFGRVYDLEILQAAKADLVGLSRPLFADPLFPRKAREGRWEEITTCLCCNYCHRLYLSDKPVECVQRIKKKG